MTQYLLSVWHDEPFGEMDMDDPDVARQVAAVGAFNADLVGAGALVFAGGLESNETATVVRPTAGSVAMTDGPYADTKEQMGGFWVIEADDLDAALGWASRGAMACERPVEVRPFQGG